MAYNPYIQPAYGYPNIGYQMPQIQTPQQSNFIHVQSEAQARGWAVAPGCSVTFMDDNEPYCYTKTMSTSQFEPPIFKRFRLVEESNVQNAQNNQQSETAAEPPNYLTKEEFEPFKAIIDELKAKIKELETNEPDTQQFKHNGKPNNSKST